MFGGCRHLKFALQWLAASHAGRPLCYFLFDETRLADRIEALLDAARQVCGATNVLFEICCGFKMLVKSKLTIS